MKNSLSNSKYFLWMLMLVMTMPAIAQAPYAFNYQGLARNANGVPLSDQQISVLISVISGSESGDLEFQEEHIVTTNTRGLFNIQVGAGTFFEGNLRNINWGENTYFIRTEIDPTGGEDYVDMGTAQLYSVPYALYAAEAGNAQNGGGGGNQRLSFTGSTLAIENGNSVDLGSLRDGVIDADSDPSNELQTLSISGNQLSIAGGNSVALPNASGGGGNSDQFWSALSTGIVYEGDFVSLVNSNFRFAATLSLDDEQNGILTTFDPSGSKLVEIGEQDLAGHLQINFIGQNIIEARVSNTGEGVITTKGPNGRVNTLQGALIGDNTANNGFVGAADQDGNQMAGMLVASDGQGALQLVGPNRKLNILATGNANNRNLGLISIRNEGGNSRGTISINSTSGAGESVFFGPNGENNVRSTTLAQNSNHGFITVYDANGNSQAGIYVDANGRGRVFADFVDAIVDDPDKAGNTVVYSMLHGPESAAYLRGTATLKEGIAEVVFPTHFAKAINAKGLTVMITPLSDRSKGIAVIKKIKTGFKVKELLDGAGNYDFDWEVKGVRAGTELLKVNRPSPQPASATLDHEEYKVQKGSK